jgi:spore coat polysaccharide biosynthesis protein SpsF
LQNAGLAYVRGSETDVLGRFYQALRRWPSHAIVRVTCDNPLVDPKIMDETIGVFEETSWRYVKTQGFPVGVGVEVFTSELLREAHAAAQSAYEREHVTPYMYTAQTNHGCYKSREDLSDIRMTMDTARDYALIHDVYKHLYRGSHSFLLGDIMDYLQSQNNKG